MSSSLFQLLYANDVTGARTLLSRSGLPATSTSSAAGGNKDSSNTKLSKQDINKRDALGRTVLHLAASKGLLEFVKALLENPATDVNLLDTESGWYHVS
jgi:inhibitor of Bruton tyrosine kinase